MLTPLSTEWKRLLRRLDKLAGSKQAAEDALQDAFLKVSDYGRDHPVAHPQALFVKVATNLALNERRRSRRAAYSEVGDLAAHLCDEQPLQDEVLAARERLVRVRAVLATLPPRTRDAFLMHRLDGMKYREIAERLAISVSAVEKHIARATLRLMDALREVEAPR